MTSQEQQWALTQNVDNSTCAFILSTASPPFKWKCYMEQSDVKFMEVTKEHVYFCGLIKCVALFAQR